MADSSRAQWPPEAGLEMDELSDTHTRNTERVNTAARSQQNAADTNPELNTVV